jgi:hypothetical protein
VYGGGWRWWWPLCLAWNPGLGRSQGAPARVGCELGCELQPDRSSAVLAGFRASEKAIGSSRHSSFLLSRGDQPGKGRLQGLRDWGGRGTRVSRLCGESSRAPHGAHTCMHARGARLGQEGCAGASGCEGLAPQGVLLFPCTNGRHSASAAGQRDTSARGGWSPFPDLSYRGFSVALRSFASGWLGDRDSVPSNLAQPPQASETPRSRGRGQGQREFGGQAQPAGGWERALRGRRRVRRLPWV